MTTIAFKDGIMAADTLSIQGGIVFAHAPKIIVNEKYCFASAGSDGFDEVFMKSLLEGYDKKINDTVMIVYDFEKKKLFRSDNGLPNYFEVRAPFTATGSGFELATGAMAHGASAIEAIEIAIKFDTHTAGMVHAYDCINRNWVREFYERREFYKRTVTCTRTPHTSK